MFRTLFTIALLLFVPVACAESEDPSWQEQSQARFNAGDLEQAAKWASLSSSPWAADMQAAIGKARVARVETETLVVNILSEAKTGSLDDARAKLVKLLNDTKDQVSRDRISKAFDELKAIAAVRGPEKPTIDPAAAAQAQPSAVISEITRALYAKEWLKGLDLVKQASDKQTAPASDLQAVRKKLIDGGTHEIEFMIGKVIELEQSKGSKAAYDLLNAARPRFPDTPEFESYWGLLHEVGKRAGVEK